MTQFAFGITRARRSSGLAVALVVLALVPVGAMFHTDTRVPPGHGDAKPDSPLQIQAAFLRPPAVGVPAALELRVVSRVAAPGTVVRVEASPAQSLAGPASALTFTVDLARDVEVVRVIPVVVAQDGTFVLQVTALHQAPGYQFGAVKNLRVTVGQFGAQVAELSLPEPDGRVSVTQEPPTGPVIAAGPRKHAAQSSAAAGITAAGQIAVTGVWKYTDRNNVAKPLHDARIEVWDADVSGDDLLATVYSDFGGNFSASQLSNIDDEGGGQDIYVKAFATDDFSVQVTLVTSAAIYSAQTTILNNASDGILNVGTTTITDVNNRMAFYIYDLIENDAFYYLANLGWVNHYNLRVRWAANNTTDGTDYTLGGSITLRAGDRWDSDVILHEYGHFVMYKVYGDSFPSTPNCQGHTFSGVSSDGCAWSEGWADFIQGAIQNDRFYDDTEDQIIHNDLEPPTPGAFSPNVEGAVAASLWDIYDGVNEAWDTLSHDINGPASNGIWSVLNFALQSSAIDFYNDWFEKGNPSTTELSAIFVHHQIVVSATTRVIVLSGNLAFGGVPVGTTTTRTLTINNTGNSALTVSSVTYPSGFSGAFAGVIAAGSSANVTVTFAPGAVTSYGGTVTVNSDKTSGTNTTSASGTGSLSVLFDLTGDARSDVLWRHNTRGEVWLWPMNGAVKQSENFVRTVPDINWEIRGQGDQNGDLKADILWRNKVTGGIVYWPMIGNVPQSETFVATVDPAYDIVGTADYNGDGMSDILWRHATNGQLWIWLMNGASALSMVHVDTVDPIYAVVGSGDLNGDGKSDIVWRNTVNGDVWVWLMNGTTRLSQTMVGTVPDLGYQVARVADHTGDGKADILWRHTTQGHVWIWPMNGAALVNQTFVATVDPIYTIVGAGDYNGDGKADVLWHHSTVGDVWVWLMNGAAITSQTLVGNVPDLGYQIVKWK